ncbi:MAG TPA: N-6 DNA methylase [Acidimicrobiales bacterium]|nr:N-6 DNA methylase [Acidimicrobiales bacterium]
MSGPVGLTSIIAQAAAGFADLGVLGAAAPLLADLGWDGQIDRGGGRSSVGSRYPRAAAPSVRRSLGIHYTPAPVARGLTSLVLGKNGRVGSPAPLRIGDPACGAGAFLVAAAEWLRSGGAPVEQIVSEQLFGADVDETALALARLEIARWSAEATGTVHVVPAAHLVAGDSLLEGDPESWIGRRAGMDVVLGNPPFGSQLRGGTVRERSRQRRLADALGVGALGYADTAALFLLRAVDLVRTDGRVALVLPWSIAAAQGSRSIRSAVGGRAQMTDVWVGGDDVGFDAAVSVWAPVLVKTDRPGESTTIRRFSGEAVRASDTVETTLDPSSWAPLLDPQLHHRRPAYPRRGPDLAEPAETIASVAEVTAGFRRHFYGLAPHTRDDPSGVERDPVLVTTGAIDPLHHRVDTSVRFAGRSYVRPVVDVTGLEAEGSAIAKWVRSMLVPKVLIASQGRVLEAIVDAEGSMIPSTPAIAVLPRETSAVTVWQVAALVTSPLTAVQLRASAAGTGMDGRGCRVTAGFVRALVLPSDQRAWDVGADAARCATAASAQGNGTEWIRQLDRLGEAMLQAVSGTSPTAADDRRDVLDWWIDQRPPWRGARLLSR